MLVISSRFSIANFIIDFIGKCNNATKIHFSELAKYDRITDVSNNFIDEYIVDNYKQ